MPPTDLEFQLTLERRLENVGLAQRGIESILEHLGFETEALEWLAAAVEEAVANAIKHGNPAAGEEPVVVRLLVHGDDVEARIADSGPGFDPGALRDPVAPENLLRRTGRGIYLMRAYTDSVEFDFPPQGGTVVTLRKRLPRR